MEWVIVAVAVLVLFGAKKIPELMKGVGKGIKDFNNAKDDVHRQLDDSINEKEIAVAKVKQAS